MMRRVLQTVVMLAMAALPSLALAGIEVDTVRLGHGVRAWYSEDNRVPVVHVIVSFEGAGSVSDPLGRAGRAALAAGMLNEGAGPYDSIGFQQALEDKAIQFSAQASGDRLTIHIHALREHAEEAGRLLALALAEPHFAEPDLARVKQQVQSYLARSEENPSYQAERRFSETAFSGHPYAGAVYGTAESVEGIAAQDLRDYMQTYIARDTMQVTAAGDVDASLLKRMLAPVVDAVGSSDAGALPVSQITMQGGGQAQSVAMDVPQSYVLFAAPGVKRSDPQFYAFYLLNEILGGSGLSSRLSDGLRQQKGLVYNVSSALDIRAGTALLSGALATRTGSAADAIAATKAMLSEISMRGVTTEECTDARTHVLGSLPLQLDNSTAVAETLMMMRIFDLGEDYLEQRDARFRAVSCADINAAARQYLVPERFLFVTAGRP